MKIADLKQPYRRMAEYLAEKNTYTRFKNKEILNHAFDWYQINDIFWLDIADGDYPPITEEIKQNFPPDFDFSGEEVVNTNPFSVDGLSLNQIAMRIFRKNFMDLELWEQGLVNETFEQNVIAKNSIIELPNNLIIKKRIYTQLAREGKFDQLPDTCEFSEPVELEVWDDDKYKDFRRITGKFKGNYMDIHCIGLQFAKLPTPKIDFSEFKAGDVVEFQYDDDKVRIGYINSKDNIEMEITHTKNQKGEMFNLEKIKTITKIK